MKRNSIDIQRSWVRNYSDLKNLYHFDQLLSNAIDEIELLISLGNMLLNPKRSNPMKSSDNQEAAGKAWEKHVADYLNEHEVAL